MSELLHLTTRERAVLDINTNDKAEAVRLAEIAKEAGARIIKLSCCASWEFCSSLAERRDLDWIADVRMNDRIPVMIGDIRSFRYLYKPPFAITLNPDMGVEAMMACQAEGYCAGSEIRMFGATALSAMSHENAVRDYNFHPDQLDGILKANLGGVVCSSLELSDLRKKTNTGDGLLVMVQGLSIDRVGSKRGMSNTPFAAMQDGADLVVLGEDVTKSNDVDGMYDDYVGKMEIAASRVA